MPVWKSILMWTALVFAFISVVLFVWNLIRAKKLREQGFVTPKSKVKLPFKLDNFIFLLGGIDNIVKTSASNNKIKIIVSDIDKVNFVKLKKIKNKGIFSQSDNVSIILGKCVSELSTMINDLVTNFNNNKLQNKTV